MKFSALKWTYSSPKGTGISLLILNILICFNSYAQFNIRKPVVNTGFCTITDTVYMSPTGNDTGNGSITSPVRSFQKALSLLPFGKAGVNDGQAYGLIRMLPGRYVTKTGFSQGESQWKNGNTYKNVSIEGVGEVILGGVSGDLCTNHTLILMGNHIFVKNLKIRQSTGMGLMIRGEPGRMMHDLLVENVDTDSLGSFGILVVNNEGVEIKNCKVLRSGQLGNEALTSPCQWPSGLKVHDCAAVTVHHCEVGFSRGEGLNFQNCLNGEAYKNTLHDNTANFYNDNSKNLIIRQNYFYNTLEGEQNFWRGCPSDTGIKNTPNGILMANEGGCTNGTVGGVIFENCQTKCLLPLDYIPNIDSIFIFNNLFHRVGEVLNIWEGSTQILGVNCIRNVFFYNNTAVGSMGNAQSRHAMIYHFMPYYNPLTSTYSRIENFQVFNNIFSVDKQTFKNIQGHIGIFHVLHPSKNEVMLGGNLWSFNAENKGSTDSISATMPGDLPYPVASDFVDFIPCDDHAYFRKKNAVFGHIPERDFLDSLRKPGSRGNVGAFEDMGTCSSMSSGQWSSSFIPKIYPNPASDRLYIMGAQGKVWLYETSGRLIGELPEIESDAYRIDAAFPIGMYWVEFYHRGKKITQRVVLNGLN